MAIAGMQKMSLRLERAETSRLAWAFAISLLAHLLLFGTYHAGRKLNLWDRLHWPAWLQSQRMLSQILKKQQLAALQPQPVQVPLMFVDVSPDQAVAEPPKNPKGYSDRNSVAANPSATKITNLPKIDGKRPEVVRTVDAPREKFLPLQPSPPKQAEQQEQPEQKLKQAYTPGDLVMAKPSPKAQPDAGDAAEAKPHRPRTVQEALARLQNNRLPGQQMKQDGGVARHALEPGFDVAASPFGAYDRALIDAVCQRWYSLLDQNQYIENTQGKVVLQFHLHPDGTITEMNVAENTVGEMLCLLCQRAILDPQPFAPWPADMKRMLGSSRSIQFTFYYN
jgi:outer membrane biosynthesis protein TonB